MIEDFENSTPMMTITRIENLGNQGAVKNKMNPADLPILPTRNLILFPEVTAPISIARENSLFLAEEASKKNILVGVICQKKPEIENPGLGDLEKYGVVARILNVIKLPNGTHTAIIQALGKFRVIGQGEGKTLSGAHISASVKLIKDTLPKVVDEDFLATVQVIKKSTLSIIDKSSEGFGMELGLNIANMDDPLMIINTVASMFPFEHEVKLHLLVLHRIKDRGFELVRELMRHEDMLDMAENIKSKARQGLEQRHRNAFLQEQMDAIREELYGDEQEDIDNLLKRAQKKRFPAEVKKSFDKEVEKLRRLAPQSPDYSVQYNYLDLILSLPWGVYTPPSNDFLKAEQELDSAHYGLEKVKDRIMEQFAVIMNNEDVKAPILCLVGPPGVGKTSIAKSVAKALGREYQRISLGGVHDEAEIRGHRRTYIGSMPGRVIDAMKRVESANPVLVLDEIDKLGNDYKGDPSSALLEVLDPEQNNHFHDNYVDLDFDLSKVLFIATANTLSTLSGPLLDRMEVIELSGYAQEEKVEIAKRHLIPKVIDNLKYDAPRGLFTDETLNLIIDEYTSESGVRQLEKNISTLLRKHLKDKLKGNAVPDVLTPDDVRRYLGVSHLGAQKYESNRYPGVVTGLAWTAAGGDILFIESSLIPGKGEKLTITGNLGDVMKESATLALQYIKANAERLGIDKEIFENNGIHIHVPEGAVPKDGPSAGITIVTSMLSAIKNEKVREKLAMTGEITLRGKVLAVGGIKEKLLAAKRAGIKTIILSEDNRKDVDDIPQQYLDNLDFIFVKDINEVIDHALTGEKA